MVPQQSVVHMPNGEAQVMVVDQPGNVVATPVKTGDVHKGWYMITSGLKGGQNVIVEGLDRVMPEVPVNAKPWQSGRDKIAHLTPKTASDDEVE